jgi:CheY-like chemotaxis protein
MSKTTRGRILVVDDEEDVQLLAGRVLTDAGFEVEAARDGGEAIVALGTARPDLIVLDLMMPGIDGWGVLGHLRAIPDAPAVVVVTARGEYATQQRAESEGAMACLIKPFRFQDLVATCEKALAASRPSAPQPAAERRVAPRRRLLLWVRVLSREAQPITLGELQDLSATGAQVELGVPLEIGARARLAFHVPGGGVTLSLDAEVKWRRDAGGTVAHGLQFVDVSPEDERRLQQMVQPV